MSLTPRQRRAVPAPRSSPAGARRRAVSGEVRIDAGAYPVLVEYPGAPSPDALRADAARLDGLLRRRGAVRVRAAFDGAAEAFARAVAALGLRPFDYVERSSPRTGVGGSIYTSTEYAPNREIPLHNENSYATVWPGRLVFGCSRAADEGGETPIADSRKVLGRIPVEVRTRFRERGVLYVRRFGGPFEMDWRYAFATERRAAVEEYCRAAGIGFEWLEDGRLVTRTTRPAIVRHPLTGDEVWFNHAALFHPSSLDADVRDALGDGVEPSNETAFGDGTPIDGAALDAIRAAYRAESVASPWRRGDLLLLDNLLASHGRRPFRGERLIWVAMSDPQRAPAATEDSP